MAGIQIVILAIGWAASPVGYSDADFVAGQLPTLLVVTLFVAVVAWGMAEPGEIGLRRPSVFKARWLIPATVMLLVAGAGFALAWSTLPEGASVDGSMIAGTLAATLLVGFTEELTYRGLLLVVFVKAVGFGRGIPIAAVAFGLLHAINPIAGLGARATAVQVIFTGLLTLVFVLVAFGTRSLWPAMVIHGLYDFFVVGSEQLEAAGAETSPAVVAAGGVGVIGAIYAMFSLRRTDLTPIWPAYGLENTDHHPARTER
ncbi:MAG: CPBP family intramembrane glutamic endopeptidase [Actinomycetota bacterium]